MTITKFVLKRPITAILAILCLLTFAWRSVMSAKLEMMPEMNIPMMIIMTTYTGANPEDVNELVTKPLEDNLTELKGLKQVSSQSQQGASMIMLEYEYGTDMETAYDNLKKKVDAAVQELPSAAGTPVIIEMNSNASVDISLVVDKPSESNLYDYVKNNISAELEKLSSVAKVSVYGGSEKYIRVQVSKEKLKQYGVTMSSIANDIKAADFSVPAGDAQVGSQELSVTTRMKYNTQEMLKNIPLTTAGENIIYLGEVADIGMASDSGESIARYNGKETVSIQLTKQQSSTAMELSSQVKNLIADLMQKQTGLTIEIVSDSSDSMKSSLKSVAETLVMAVVISMAVIWLFFEDLKASLIVGSSIPISIMASLIAMKLMGLSLNIITMSALTLGVGMMVDNSIVVLESCFRVTERKAAGFVEYREDALEGTSLVASSVAASTITTCIVFLPLAFLQGMTGQLFKPLGYTIVFCMAASLLSSLSAVPLFYMMYRPKEKEKAPLSRPLEHLQEAYRRFLKRILPRKKLVMGVSVLLLAFSIFLGMSLNTELIAADDQGTISVSVSTRPGMQTEKADRIVRQVEAVIAGHGDLKSYMTEVSSGNSRISVYLKDDRKMTTSQIASQWRKALAGITDCTITVENSGSMSMMSKNQMNYEVILKSGNYEELKQTTKKISDELTKRPEVLRVSSDSGNAAPLIEITVDAIRAKAKGVSPSDIGSTVSAMMSGIEARTMNVNGQNVSIKVKYPEGTYKTLSQIRNIVLSDGKGGFVPLTDVADIGFKESPVSVLREGKDYKMTITASYTEQATDQTEETLNREVVQPNLSANVTTGLNSTDRSMNTEFASLANALGTAVFLIFVVMAAQFESPKFSVMVMVTVPFSLIGAFGFLWLADGKISMVSLLGFLMLIGTVVNSGILYVDTVNQYRLTMNQEMALIEAGASRLRPILMTTLTTILSMIPMAMAIGNAGATTRDLALVNIGGLTASTVLSLLMLPVFYSMLNRMPKETEAAG